MSIIKKTKSNFAVVPREAMERNDISLKAKGLLAYLLCLPDDWQIYIEQLSAVMKEGREAIAGAINELRDTGYIIRHIKKDENGRFAGYDYTVHDTPTNVNAEMGKTDYGKTEMGKTEMGKTEMGKTSTTNIERTKKERTKKEIERAPEIEKDACLLAVEENRKKLTTMQNVQAPFESDKCKALWEDWQEHLRQKGKAPSRVTLERHAKDLRMHPESVANAMIEQAIAKGWSSIYPLDKKEEAPKGQQRKSAYSDVRGRTGSNFD